ncbi:transcription termination/antitermination protein NusG, partial [Francisella tularensis subsp. holarctica]|uniref:transcription termination/antitermination NusG family protein n=1 Tax=Francisella tularensis TaxID=263 RepID=UPI0023819652
PGYVVIEADLSTDSWNLVKSFPRVLTVVGSKGKPIPFSKAEVDRILGFVEGSKSTVEPRFRKSYHVVEVVRVLEGPFNDFTGFI